MFGDTERCTTVGLGWGGSSASLGHRHLPFLAQRGTHGLLGKIKSAVYIVRCEFFLGWWAGRGFYCRLLSSPLLFSPLLFLFWIQLLVFKFVCKVVFRLKGRLSPPLSPPLFLPCYPFSQSGRWEEGREAWRARGFSVQ